MCVRFTQKLGMIVEGTLHSLVHDFIGSRKLSKAVSGLHRVAVPGEKLGKS